jgi:hypothetical protein
MNVQYIIDNGVYDITGSSFPSALLFPSLPRSSTRGASCCVRIPRGYSSITSTDFIAEYWRREDPEARRGQGCVEAVLKIP